MGANTHPEQIESTIYQDIQNTSEIDNLASLENELPTQSSLNDMSLSREARILKSHLRHVEDTLMLFKPPNVLQIIMQNKAKLQNEIENEADAAKNMIEEKKTNNLEIAQIYAQKLIKLSQLRESEIGTILAGIERENEEIKAFVQKWKDYFNQHEITISDEELAQANLTMNECIPKIRRLQEKMEYFADQELAIFDANRWLLRNTRLSKDIFIEETSVKTRTFQSSVICVIFLSDSQLAVCEDDSFPNIQVWNLGTEAQEPEYVLNGHTDTVYCLAVLPNDFLVSGSADSNLIIWNTSQRTLVKTLSSHKDTVISVRALGSERIVSYSFDNTLIIWVKYLTDYCRVFFLNDHGNEGFSYSFGILSSGYLVTCTRSKISSPNADDDCILKVWDPDCFVSIREIPTGSKNVWCLHILSDDRIVLGFDDGLIKVFDLNDPFKNRVFQAHQLQEGVEELLELPNGCLLSAGEEDDNKIFKIWNIHHEICLAKVISGHQDSIKSLSVSPNGQLLVSAGHDCCLKIWNLIDRASLE